MRRTLFLVVWALVCCSSAMAGDFAENPLNFSEPQQDLIDNLNQMLREANELQDCEKQQEEALQRFLALGFSVNAAALMAHNQYPCD